MIAHTTIQPHFLFVMEPPLLLEHSKRGSLHGTGPNECKVSRVHDRWSQIRRKDRATHGIANHTCHDKWIVVHINLQHYYYYTCVFLEY